MGDIRKRGDYQWQARIRRKNIPTQTKTFDTKAEAEAWVSIIESEMGRGVFVSRKEAENTTLSEALDRYEREIIPAKKGSVQESMRIRIWKRSFLSNRSLASIQGKDIAKYRDSRLKGDIEKGIKPVGPNTVRHELALLSHLFTIAVKEWGLAGVINPVSQIRIPNPPQGRDRRLKQEELERIIPNSSSKVLPDIILLAIETGIRQGELVGMTWDLIDLKKRTITLLDTKNGKKRIVPLSTEAVRILERIPRRLDGKVFDLFSPQAVAIAFRRAVSRARAAYLKEFEEENKEKKNPASDPAFLVDLHFHDLRHEATTRFFEKGLNPMQVAAITEHKTLQMLKRYTHLKAEDLAELLK